MHGLKPQEKKEKPQTVPKPNPDTEFNNGIRTLGELSFQHTAPNKQFEELSFQHTAPNKQFENAAQKVFETMRKVLAGKATLSKKSLDNADMLLE